MEAGASSDSVTFAANRYGGTEGMVFRVDPEDGGKPCTGAAADGFCLTDGIAAGWKVVKKDYALGIPVNRHTHVPYAQPEDIGDDSCYTCVHREPKGSQQGSFEAMPWSDLRNMIYDYPDFNKFVSKLEQMHGFIHINIGGAMSNVPASARDPIFYVHHANIDGFFISWQKYYSRSTDPETASTVPQNMGPQKVNFYGKEAVGFGGKGESTLNEETATNDNWMGIWDLEENCLNMPKHNPVACIQIQRRADANFLEF
jgi:hypothetical protein